MTQPELRFSPHPLARPAHFQTIASSLVHPAGRALTAAARAVILETEAGVRLAGVYSPQPAGKQPRGLVLLLHGWLGSAQSGYVVAMGDHLYRQGYAVFRLNLRDHGDTHALNFGVFRSDMLDEVVAATRQVAALAPAQPLHLIGASLGGNFALRLAWQFNQTPLPNLQHTIAISPAIDPLQTTLSLDNGPWVYLAYFRRKWRRTLQKKQALFPQLYDFSEALAAPTCMGMTEAFMRRYSPYPDARAYFAQYTITPAMLAAMRTPVTLITAADDPIVPVHNFKPFAGINGAVRLYIQPYGGHVGFVDVLPWRYWLCAAVSTILAG